MHLKVTKFVISKVNVFCLKENEHLGESFCCSAEESMSPESLFQAYGFLSIPTSYLAHHSIAKAL